MNNTGIRLGRSQVFVIGFISFFIIILLLLRIILIPILIAFLIAFVLDPLISKVEKHGVKRWATSFAVVILGCFLVILAAWILLPILFDQLQTLFSQFPAFKKHAEERWLPIILETSKQFFGTHTREDTESKLREILSSSFFPQPEALLSGISKGTQKVAFWVLEVVITPIITFFVLKNVPEMMQKVRSAIPLDVREKYSPVVREFNNTLHNVLLGQVLTVTLLSILYSTAFTFAGMPLGFAVGFITGIVRLIPYMDIVIGGSLAIFVLITHTPIATSVIVASGASFAAIQILDMFLLTPRILGKFSGIHPLLIVLAVLCFGDWLGFLGVLLAIPLAAIARVAITSLLNEYQQSDFFRNGKHVKTME